MILHRGRSTPGRVLAVGKRRVWAFFPLRMFVLGLAGGVMVEHCGGGKARCAAVRSPTARDADKEGRTNWVVLATDGCIDSPLRLVGSPFYLVGTDLDRLLGHGCDALLDSQPSAGTCIRTVLL